MEPYRIKFLLYCDWAHFPQSYRVYFNGELMTERDYLWNNNDHVLQEILPVFADKTSSNNIIIEPLGQRTGKLRVDRLETEPPGLSVKINIV